MSKYKLKKKFLMDLVHWVPSLFYLMCRMRNYYKPFYAKVYVLDKENKPVPSSTLDWDAWRELLPLMQFYIGDYDKSAGPGDSTAKWGFFNFLTGEISVAPTYDYVYPFYGKNLAKVIKNKKTGFIDENGTEVGGIVWDDAHNFVNASACAVRKGNLWGFMGMDGSLVFEPQFDDIGSWTVLYEVAPCSNPTFSEAVRQVNSKIGYTAFVKKAGKYGFIDDHGGYFVEPLYDDARDFWNGHYAPVKLYGKWGLIERSGAFAVPPKFSEIGENSSNTYVVNLDGTWGILAPGLDILMPEKGTRFVVFDDKKIYLKNGQVTSYRKIK